MWPRCVSFFRRIFAQYFLPSILLGAEYDTNERHSLMRVEISEQLNAKLFCVAVLFCFSLRVRCLFTQVQELSTTIQANMCMCALAPSKEHRHWKQQHGSNGTLVYFVAFIASTFGAATAAAANGRSCDTPAHSANNLLEYKIAILLPRSNEIFFYIYRCPSLRPTAGDKPRDAQDEIKGQNSFV